MVTKPGTIFLLFVGALYTTEAAITGWTNPASTNGAATPDIDENTAVGPTSVTIAATGNAGGDVSYAIDAQPTTGKLTIASDTGILSLAVGTFDFETEPTYVLSIIATDSDNTVGTATVTLSIADVNEAPTFASSQYTANVPDASTGGTAVTTVSATDDDASDTITYSITGGNTNTDFDIDGTTGAITVASGKTLDAGTTATYTLTVTASDAAGLTATATVSITVQDSGGGTAISWTTPENGIGTLSLKEDQAADTTIETYLATGTGTVTYALTPAVSPFALTEGGDLTITAALDHETTKTYTLVIVATDETPSTGTATTTVTVTDVNEHDPVFSAATYRPCIVDRSTAGTTLMTVSATDKDTSDTITYAISSGDPENDFKIDTGAGLIQVNDGKILNNTATATYGLVVTAEDTVAPVKTGTTTVSVTVADFCDSGTAVAALSIVMLLVSLFVTLF